MRIVIPQVRADRVKVEPNPFQSGKANARITTRVECGGRAPRATTPDTYHAHVRT